MKFYITAFWILSGIMNVSAQYSDNFYIVNITGAESILLNKVDYNNSDYGIDHKFVYGTIYPNEAGIICLNLPRGQYEYIAEGDGIIPQHGTFYISNRNIKFDLCLRPSISYNEDRLQSTRLMVRDANTSIDNKKYKEARKLFKLAAEDGNADGMYCLAFMLKNGVGGKKDRKQAVFWLQQAYNHGHYAAQDRLEYFHEKWKWGYMSIAWGKSRKYIQ